MNVLQWFNLKAFGGYLGGNLLFQLISFAAEFAVLKMVDIEEVGLWQMALLIQGYVIISRLGIINAYNLEYPLAIAKKDEDSATRISETMNVHIIFTMVFQALSFLIAGVYMYWFKENSVLAWVFWGMILFTIIEASSNYEEAKKRAELDFKSVGRARSLGSVFVAVTLALPFFFGMMGLVVRAILNQLFFTVYYKVINPSKKYERTFSIKAWLELFQTGWKLWLWSYLKTVGKSMPRLFVVTFLGVQALGLFAPVQWILASFVLFSSSVSSYLYPKLTHLVATHSEQVTWKAFVITGGTIFILIPAAAVGHYLIPLFFQKLFPEYANVIPAVQLVIWASLLELFSLVASSWVSQKKWNYMFTYVIGALILRIGGMAIPYFKSTPELLDVSKGIIVSAGAIAVLIVLLMVAERMSNWVKITSS
jgi:O-antigen/teichoic acid export membrane protein